MCHRFVIIPRDEVRRIAEEVAANLAAHAGESAYGEREAGVAGKRRATPGTRDGSTRSTESTCGKRDARNAVGACAVIHDEAAYDAPRERSDRSIEDTCGERKAQGATGKLGKRNRMDGLEKLDSLETYRGFLSRPVPDDPSGAPREAFPSSVVPLIAPTGQGMQLAVADMVWGFEVEWKQGPVFNTRIETALSQPKGMWGASLARRRCIVPARVFYESHGSETITSKRSGRPVKRQYAFDRSDGTPLLLAGIHDRGHFSIVTAESCATVASVHNRMPLVLDAAEAALWLAGRYDTLLDRSAIALRSTPEC